MLENKSDRKTAGASVLKNLIMHRKVCNHPALINDELAKAVDDGWSISGKLIGLVELLVECEIISASTVSGETGVEEQKNISNDILGTIADVFGGSA